MDVRIVKTKNSIINAFLELRSQKNIEKITVKELCEKAMINKSTFIPILLTCMLYPNTWKCRLQMKSLKK